MKRCVYRVFNVMDYEACSVETNFELDGSPLCKEHLQKELRRLLKTVSESMETFCNAILSFNSSTIAATTALRELQRISVGSLAG